MRKLIRVRHKILTGVDCPMDLDMGQFLANSDKTLDFNYELYGIIVSKIISIKYQVICRYTMARLIAVITEPLSDAIMIENKKRSKKIKKRSHNLNGCAMTILMFEQLIFKILNGSSSLISYFTRKSNSFTFI